MKLDQVQFIHFGKQMKPIIHLGTVQKSYFHTIDGLHFAYGREFAFCGAHKMAQGNIRRAFPTSLTDSRFCKKCLKVFEKTNKERR